MDPCGIPLKTKNATCIQDFLTVLQNERALCTLKRVSAENGPHVHLPRRLWGYPTAYSPLMQRKTMVGRIANRKTRARARTATSQTKFTNPNNSSGTKKIFAGGQVSSTHWLNGPVRSIVLEEGSFNTGEGDTMGARDASASEQK